jgi:hypothetical protein
MASDELKRLIFRDLMRPWTSESFRSGAVPTGASLAWGSSAFVEDVVKSFPEFSEDASRMKWDSSSYVFAGTIFTRPSFMGSRIGAGIITARAGDGALRQEWIFEPTDDDPLVAYYSLEPGSTFGPLGHHTNELAAEAQKTGEFGAYYVGSGPRIDAHWPKRDDFAEPEFRALIDDAQKTARSLSRKPRP